MASAYQNPEQYYSVSPITQLLLIAASLIAIGAALTYNLYVFQTNDTHEPLRTVTQQKLNQWNAHPIIVKTGLYIREFQEFDFSTNQFTLKGTVWFELPQESSISVDDLGDFEFEKSVTTTTAPLIKQLENGDTLVQYNVTVQLKSPLNHRQFPLDDHRLYLVLIHNILQPKDILFDSSPNALTIDPEIKIPGWRVIGTKVQTGYLKTSFDSTDEIRSRHYSAALFEIDYARNASRLIISILLPLLFLFFLSMFSFSVDYKLCMTLATAAITGILGYRFVIERLSPLAARDYFTFSDHFFMIYFVAVSSVFLVTAYDLFAQTLSKGTKQLACYLFYVITTLSCVYLLTVWQ